MPPEPRPRCPDWLLALLVLAMTGLCALALLQPRLGPAHVALVVPLGVTTVLAVTGGTARLAEVFRALAGFVRAARGRRKEVRRHPG